MHIFFLPFQYFTGFKFNLHRDPLIHHLYIQFTSHPCPHPTHGKSFLKKFFKRTHQMNDRKYLEVNMRLGCIWLNKPNMANSTPTKHTLTLIFTNINFSEFREFCPFSRKFISKNLKSLIRESLSREILLLFSIRESLSGKIAIFLQCFINFF